MVIYSKIKGSDEGNAFVIRLAASSEACRSSSAYLIRESAGSKITKRELEFSIATVDINLEDNERVRVGC